ncbi:hypothetical protein JOM56_000870 [Amanita muscaria]
MFDRNRAFCPSRERDDVPTPTTVIDTPTVVADSASVDGIDTPSTSTARATDDDGITTAPPSEPTSSGLAVVKQPNQAKNDEERVWNARNFKISILNPTTSTSPTPTTSVTKFYRVEEIPASTDTAFERHVKQVQPLLPPPPRQITTLPLALAEPRLIATSAVTLMTEVGERTLMQSPEDSNRVASSAQDVSLVSSPSVHEQSGTSDVLPPKNIQGSSLWAVVHATRVMTSDYGSVGKYVSPQVAELAHVKVTQARDEEVVFREKDNEKLKDAVARNKITSFEV